MSKSTESSSPFSWLFLTFFIVVVPFYSCFVGLMFRTNLIGLIALFCFSPWWFVNKQARIPHWLRVYYQNILVAPKSFNAIFYFLFLHTLKVEKLYFTSVATLYCIAYFVFFGIDLWVIPCTILTLIAYAFLHISIVEWARRTMFGLYFFQMLPIICFLLFIAGQLHVTIPAFLVFTNFHVLLLLILFAFTVYFLSFSYKSYEDLVILFQ